MYQKKWIAIALAAIFAFSLLWMTMRQKEEEFEKSRLFSFYLPWDDSEENAVSLNGLLEKPAGRLGHVHVEPDGHLYVGDKRIRFLGVNICGGSSFPRKEDADEISARLAKFGVNIVRFHHMDASWERFNIFDRTRGNTRHLNVEALGRLDYFISQLKENGVYVDLNLLVSRRFTRADGLPAEIDEVDWKDQQVLGFFFDDVMELEKEYARLLLTHRNPYTGLTYAEDPAVAFVEIVNEQGLIHGWLGGVIDRLPTVFKDALREKWNGYLASKYGSTSRLLEAWRPGVEGLSEEIIGNGFFLRGLEGWVVEVHDGAKTSYGIIDGPLGVKVLAIKVLKLGTMSWNIQFNYPSLRVKAGETYLVRFKARADRQVKISVSIMQAHEPWKDLANRIELELTPEWRDYEIALVASASEENARLDISDLGAALAEYQFSSFSMMVFGGYSLREGENLEESTVNIFSLSEFGKRTPAARKDWIEFLYKLEEDYFTDLYDYLRHELGVKALIIGTILGCSTPNVMARLDVIDTHAYWQHPVFPGRPWDPRNWYVVNEPMLDRPVESTISRLALERIYGKPHLVSEYNHPFPNMYDAETSIVLSAYAALQDWDGIFLFDYGRLDDWDSERIRRYFDVDQHPVKMATLIPAHMIFVRGDVRPAEKIVTARLSREKEMEIILSGGARAWALPDGSHLGIPSAAPFVHRTALVVEGGREPAESLDEMSVRGPVYRSDTGEVIWDSSSPGGSVLIVDTSRSKAVVGFSGGRRFNLGDIIIEPGNTLLDGWSAMTLTVMEGEDFENWDRLLLVAGGCVINTGMRLRDYETGSVIATGSKSLGELKPYGKRITCGESWGSAPTLVEGVPATVRIKTSRDIEVWALNNIGERTRRVPVSTEGGYKVFKIGPDYETIWYEISAAE
jgi:hypothetical protein